MFTHTVDRMINSLDCCPWGAVAGRGVLPQMASGASPGHAGRRALYTPDERRRRDDSPWTLVQGVLAPVQFAVFLVSLIIVSIVTVKISDFILDSKIGALDRSLGFVFGMARGLLICVIGYAFFAWLVPPDKQPTWVRESKAKPLLESSGESLMAMLPQDLDTQLNRLRRPGSEGTEPPTEGDRPATAPAAPRGPQQRT